MGRSPQQQTASRLHRVSKTRSYGVEDHNTPRGRRVEDQTRPWHTEQKTKAADHTEPKIGPHRAENQSTPSRTPEHTKSKIRPHRDSSQKTAGKESGNTKKTNTKKEDHPKLPRNKKKKNSK